MIRLNSNKNEYVKNAVKRRDGGKCSNCSKFSQWEAAHIRPVNDGGGCCGLNNYKTLCIECHREESLSDRHGDRRWTKEEESMLRRAVTKHGKGHWAKMLDDPAFKFRERTGVNLKDKW